MAKVFDFLPTPLNTANDLSASGFVNARTGYQTNAGGLTIGDYLDLDADAAQGLASTTIGPLYQGGYRRIFVSAGATAANVARGKAAYLAPGSSVVGALILTQGSGQTVGTYTIAGVGGGGTGAIIAIDVLTATTLSAPRLVAAGANYTSAPTFTIPSGGTPGTLQAQMSIPQYTVTSRDVSGVNLQLPKGVFLNSITPGNYGWIQEEGVATFLTDATTTTAAGDTLTPFTPTNGTFRGIAAATAPLASAFGVAIDAPIASSYVRGFLSFVPDWPFKE